MTTLFPLFLSIASVRQTVPVVIWAFFIGISLAILSLWFRQAVLGRAVRALKEQNAFTSQTAKTAEELHLSKNPLLLRLILRSIRKGSLARYIHTVHLSGDGESEFSGNSAPVESYYLDEEKSVQADLRYTSKGASLYFIVIGLILYLIATFLLARYLPELLIKYLGKYL